MVEATLGGGLMARAQEAPLGGLLGGQWVGVFPCTLARADLTLGLMAITTNPPPPAPESWVQGSVWESHTGSLSVGGAWDDGRGVYDLIPPGQLRGSPVWGSGCWGEEGPRVPSGHLISGARRGHPQGGGSISLGPVISPRVHRTLLGLTCNHALSPPPPEPPVPT